MLMTSNQHGKKMLWRYTEFIQLQLTFLILYDATASLLLLYTHVHKYFFLCAVREITQFLYLAD
jgi:hypothetical protein